MLVATARPSSAQSGALERIDEWPLGFLGDYIKGDRGQHRRNFPADLLAELPAYPRWPPGCADSNSYFANVNSEMVRRCGPVVEKIAADTKKSCLQGVQSPLDLAARAPACGAQLLTAPFWVSKIAPCSITSLFTGFEMSEQDREDIAVRVQGALDLQQLLGLYDVFESGELANLHATAPRTIDEAKQLLAKAQTIAAQEKKRVTRLSKVPTHLRSLAAAILTLPSVRRAEIERQIDAAAAALEACDARLAQALQTMAELSAWREVAHRMANVTVAENDLHCMARPLWTHWTRAQKLSYLGVRDLVPMPGAAQLRQELGQAHHQLSQAIETYRNVTRDRRVNTASLALAEQERLATRARLVEVVESSASCLASCGFAGQDCDRSMVLSKALIEAETKTACGASVAREMDEDATTAVTPRLSQLRNALLTRDIFTPLIGKASASITSALHRCDLERARRGLTKIEADAQWAPFTDEVPQCIRQQIAGVEDAIGICEMVCASPGIRSCGKVGAEVRLIQRGTG